MSADIFVTMVAYTEYATDARVRREAETLAAHGFKVRCFCLATPSTASTFVLDGVEVAPLKVSKYRGKSKVSYLASYLRFLAYATAACARLALTRQLHVLHVHNIPDFLVVAGLLPRLLGCKVVLDVHDSVPETFATKFSSRSVIWKLLCLEEQLSAMAAHRVICVNHPQRDTLVARGTAPRKTFVSMNVPDPRIFGRMLKGDESTATDQLNLVYHGTMARRLGVDLIIRAVAELRDRVPGVLLHLWGHGDDLGAFQELARELDLTNHVLFRPQGFRLEDLSTQLRDMDVGVVGNRPSAACDLMLPVKLLEYVALDIPAVVPRLRTIRHYFAEDMVAFYEPEDVASLADAIYRLHLDRQLRTRQAARAREFLTEHGWERQGGDLAAFYHALVES